MKKIVLILSILILGNYIYAQVNTNFQMPVSINSSGNAPDPSAMLDVESTDKGVLVPRMTMAQRNAISAPATGLLVYQIDAIKGFYYYDGILWKFINPNLVNPDPDPTNELQVLSRSGNTVTLSQGGGQFVDFVNDADFIPTNELQTISKSGNTVTLSLGGGSFTDDVNDADSDPNNEKSNLNLSGDVLSLSNPTTSGNSVNLSAYKELPTGGTLGQVLTTDGSGNTSWTTPSGSSSCMAFGDGTAGNLVVSSNTDWCVSPPANGNYMFNDLTINAGVTLTVPSGAVIKVANNFVNNGTILVKEGIPGQRWFGHPDNGFPQLQGLTLSTSKAYEAEQIRTILEPGVLGGSNGQDGGHTGLDALGGPGGGVVVIRASGSFTNSGAIRANGGDGATLPPGSDIAGCSGGGGGLILLVCNGNITNAGTIEAKGGDGKAPGDADDDHAGGGGGGGAIHLIAPNANAVGGTLNVNGGAPGTEPSGNTGASGGTGGAGVGGDGGRGGDDNYGNGPFTPAQPGSTGYILRTQVATPCNLMN